MFNRLKYLVVLISFAHTVGLTQTQATIRIISVSPADSSFVDTSSVLEATIFYAIRNFDSTNRYTLSVAQRMSSGGAVLPVGLSETLLEKREGTIIYKTPLKPFHWKRGFDHPLLVHFSIRESIDRPAGKRLDERITLDERTTIIMGAGKLIASSEVLRYMTRK